MERVILSPKQKALRINLDPDLYGTFAEIGAGQEVVRHFFRAGGASGTIAKTMSAYDKDFSDAIYGREPLGRYVCESRVRTMLDHEYNLILERLDRDNHQNKRFFAYANTMATIDFRKKNKGHGWMGLKFQVAPDREPNAVVIHVRLHENETSLQQETIGVLGVNLLYACNFYHNDSKELLKSLYDNLTRDQVEIDMVQMDGPDFANVDNRILSLQLVKNGMTDAVIFNPDRTNMQAADVLYKKNILTIRGSFRPVTKVNFDMILKGHNKFITEYKVEKENLQVLFEITLNNLSADGEIDEQDFIDRADILCTLGQTVLISNYQEYYKLVDYFSNHTKSRMGLIMGVDNMIELFNEKYYRKLKGGILEAFGILFMRDLKIYLYPRRQSENSELITSKNFPVHPRLKPLYDYLVSNGRIVDIEDYDESVLHINSREVLKMIRESKPNWEKMVPDFVDTIIKSNHLFGYNRNDAERNSADSSIDSENKEKISERDK